MGKVAKIKDLRLWHYRVIERVRVFAQVEVDTEQSMRILIDYLKKSTFQGKQLVGIGSEHINRLLIYDISPAAKEDEIYGILRDISKGLFGVTLFDTNTPQGLLTAGVALVEYDDYLSARNAMLAIIQRRTELRAVLSPDFKIMWAEPLFDYFAEFALCTRALHIKNLPVSFPYSTLVRLFEKHGTIIKIRRYASHAFLYFSKPSEARKAFECFPDIELSSGVICKLSLTRIKLKESNNIMPPLPQATNESNTSLLLAQQIPLTTFLELGPNENQGLTELLLRGSLPDYELLLNKSRSIVKHIAILQAHSSDNEQTNESLVGKRVNPNIPEEIINYKQPRIEQEVNPLMYQQSNYHTEQTYLPRPTHFGDAMASLNDFNNGSQMQQPFYRNAEATGYRYAAPYYHQQTVVHPHMLGK